MPNPSPLNLINKLQILRSIHPLPLPPLRTHPFPQFPRQTLRNHLIRHHSNNHPYWYTQKTENDGDGPLIWIETDDVEGAAADEDDHYLPAYHDDVYDYEEEIAVDAFEDIKFIIEAAVARGPSY